MKAVGAPSGAIDDGIAAKAAPTARLALQTLGHPEARVLRCLRDSPVSTTWQVDLAGALAVLRIDRPLAARLGLDRRREPAVLGVVAGAGLGPRPLAADPARGLLLTEWLPGRTWAVADTLEPTCIRQAAALLRRVHELPVEAPPLDLPAAVERYGSLASPDREGLLRETRERARDWLQGDGAGSASGAPLRRPALCHNDPVAGNVIATPDGLRLIDWEYAAPGDPWFDLAVYAGHHRLAPEAGSALLQAYLGREASERERARLREGIRLYASLQALWVAAVRLL